MQLWQLKMNQPCPVPRLNLAPKRKHPLSLWNPLDYLHLLYWVFYFPQAVRWYVETFGGGYIPPRAMNWRKGWEVLRENPIQQHLLLQGILLSTIAPLSINLLLEQVGIPVNWLGVALNVTWGVLLGLVLSVTRSIAQGVVSTVTWSVVGGLVLSTWSDVALGITLGVTLAAIGGVMGGVARGIARDVGLGVALGVVGSMAFGTAKGLGFSVAFVAAILRVDSYLLCLPWVLLNPKTQYPPISHVFPFPLPFVASQLTSWLQQDWKTGLHNVNQVLAYTLQCIPAIQAVNRSMAEIPPEHVMLRVAQLAEDPFDWLIVGLISASLTKALISKAIDSFFVIFPASWQARLKSHVSAIIRIDTPTRATAAGFWLLHEKKPVLALKAFTVVRSLPEGEEMFTLAQTLAVFQSAKKLSTIAKLQVPTFPKEPLLRSTTWQALTHLHRVLQDIQVVKCSVSRTTRACALNRAQGKLKRIIDNAEILPQSEQGLIVDIAKTWQAALQAIASDVGEIAMTQPVHNPYIIGDAVIGDCFVGREETIRQLEEVWTMGDRLQSVVLYGHRCMGKTSILKNVAQHLKTKMKIAYVDLLQVGDASQGVGKILIAIADAIFQVINIQPPTDQQLLSLPLPTFRLYFEKVADSLEHTSLIIVLDEFEKIKELIEAGQIPQNFFSYLQELVQKSSKVSFALAGLYTPEEMTSNYFQLFFSSLILIRVSFLERGATHQLLAYPTFLSSNKPANEEDFVLDYTLEALEKIYAITYGQPYLVQLVGFQLVCHYNNQVFAQGLLREPILTVEDVETVISSPEFFQQGRYYFEGLWSQAAQGAPGQQAILQALASHPTGLSLRGLCYTVGLETHTIQQALKTLQHHDVIKETEGRWFIVIELFRRWLFRL